MKTRTFGNHLCQLLFPQRHCLLCGAVTGAPGLCAGCEAKRLALHCCDICAAFIEEPGLCISCASRRPRFAQARAVWPYTGAMRDRLRAFKYKEQTWLRRPLALLLAQTFQEHYAGLRFDAVLPAPLSAERLKQRGYNQSQLLSSIFAAEVGLTHNTRLLQRLKDTPPLATYNGAQRHALLKQAFAASAKAEGLTILVIDDIYTSGATLTACTDVLCAAGAKQVYALTAAGHLRNKKQEFTPGKANNMDNGNSMEKEG